MQTDTCCDHANMAAAVMLSCSVLWQGPHDQLMNPHLSAVTSFLDTILQMSELSLRMRVPPVLLMTQLALQSILKIIRLKIVRGAFNAYTTACTLFRDKAT